LKKFQKILIDSLKAAVQEPRGTAFKLNNLHPILLKLEEKLVLLRLLESKKKIEKMIYIKLKKLKIDLKIILFLLAMLL
jgi:hypothetical protein